jgi:uncharacterized protein YdhG (YjbR/CyaY superfamily)
MKPRRAAPKDITEYIAAFPDNVQEILEAIRMTIRKAAPGAEETIKYQMPTFTSNGNLVHFSAYKNHIGFYPAPTEDPQFRDELSAYASGKGTLRFPFDKPVPLELIARIVEFRVKSNLAKAEAKRMKR